VAPGHAVWKTAMLAVEHHCCVNVESRCGNAPRIARFADGAVHLLGRGTAKESGGGPGPPPPGLVWLPFPPGTKIGLANGTCTRAAAFTTRSAALTPWPTWQK